MGDRYNQQFMDLSTRLTSAFEGLQSPITQLSAALGKQDTALADAVKRLEAHTGLALLPVRRQRCSLPPWDWMRGEFNK